MERIHRICRRLRHDGWRGEMGCISDGVKKRRLSHDNQSFVNLKSNTMKNTMQRYGFFRDLQ